MNPMYDKDRIIYQLERTRVLSLQMIERVPHDQWFEMPLGVTHVAWNVGHMAIAEYFLGLVFVRGTRESDRDFIPESYVELFGYGSVATSDRSSYPSPSEMLEVLGSVHAILLNETTAMPAAELSESCKFLEGEFDHHPIFEDKGGALEWLGYHEHVHMGAIGLLRRELGSKPIEYFQESREGKRFA
ncbi:DinB family protein [Rhodopirellula sp.]|nr:DinB family protein [Rhodopirellula sp.]MDA7914639.1 DinB family protein [bacterium]MDB4394243.1 DinB family protein [Rhodopirellula sp.]MDB4561464.1 DinB family protein [bacterium]